MEEKRCKHYLNIRIFAGCFAGCTGCENNLGDRCRYKRVSSCPYKNTRDDDVSCLDVCRGINKNCPRYEEGK